MHNVFLKGISTNCFLLFTNKEKNNNMLMQPHMGNEPDNLNISNVGNNTRQIHKALKRFFNINKNSIVKTNKLIVE